MLVLDFDKSLREVSAKILNDVNYGTPHRLKRVKGTEQMIVGCDRHIAILEFDGRQMLQIASLKNIHDNEITDFVMRGAHLYSTAFNEPLIKATRFGNTNGGIVATERVVSTRPSPLSGSPYSNFATTKNPHPALIGLEKVVATPDGGTVYTGGKGLHVFKASGTGLTPVDIDANRGIFLNLKE